LRYEALQDANNVYRVGASCSVRRVGVHADPVTAFTERLRDLERAVGDLRTDDYWSTGLGYLRRRRFFVQAMPLNVADPALELLAYVARTRDHFSACRSLYPEFADLVDETCNTLTDLLMSQADPLSDAISAAVAESGADRVGVVLPTFGFEQHVQRHLRMVAGSDDVDVVTPRNLAMKRPYDLLFVLGSPMWYLRNRWGWVYTAPRASELVMLGYESQVAGRLPSVKAFSQSQMAVEAVEDDPAPVEERLDTTSEEAVVDWSFVSGEAARRIAGADVADLVEARLFLLASGCATFLGESDDSRVPTVEPDAPQGSRIVYLPPSEIVPGSVVLLRSQGGGDLIVAVANAVLGPAAAALREMQEGWKSRLRSLVDDDGIARVVADLKDRGSIRANKSNVTNWCSPRSLRTDDKQDFLAIMRAIGLASEADKYWSAMGRLDGAHRRAGRQIREQLEEQAENADLAVLEEQGRADFTLSQGGGALTAFRVEEVSPQVVAVPYQQLGDPFEARA
jgi:hypothetical protein